jgi:ketosteroid isomerase-like protein
MWYVHDRGRDTGRAMSEENVEVVQQVIAAYSGTGEVRDELIDPDIEVWESAELPGELAGRGHAALLRAKETLSDSFEAWSVEPERFFDLGERILVFVAAHTKGRGSGVEASGPMAYLFTLRDGKVIEWGLFGDRSKALEAAGLQE